MRSRTMYMVAVAALLALVSVGCEEGIERAPIDTRGLTGDWANEAGTRFAFRADGTATGTGLHGSLPRGTACPDTWNGAWAFLGLEVGEGEEPPENPDGSLAAGDVLDLTASGAGAECSAQMSVGRDEKGFGLCLVEDPGVPCTGRELLRGAGQSATGRPAPDSRP
ncbi:hypothetical protein ACWDR0_26360 [Streptomyces sp. NPDC003691]